MTQFTCERLTEGSGPQESDDCVMARTVCGRHCEQPDTRPHSENRSLMPRVALKFERKETADDINNTASVSSRSLQVDGPFVNDG